MRSLLSVVVVAANGASGGRERGCLRRCVRPKTTHFAASLRAHRAGAVPGYGAAAWPHRSPRIPLLKRQARPRARGPADRTSEHEAIFAQRSHSVSSRASISPFESELLGRCGHGRLHWLRARRRHRETRRGRLGVENRRSARYVLRACTPRASGQRVPAALMASSCAAGPGRYGGRDTACHRQRADHSQTVGPGPGGSTRPAQNTRPEKARKCDCRDRTDDTAPAHREDARSERPTGPSRTQGCKPRPRTRALVQRRIGVQNHAEQLGLVDDAVDSDRLARSQDRGWPGSVRIVPGTHPTRSDAEGQSVGNPVIRMLAVANVAERARRRAHAATDVGAAPLRGGPADGYAPTREVQRPPRRSPGEVGRKRTRCLGGARTRAPRTRPRRRSRQPPRRPANRSRIARARAPGMAKIARAPTDA